MFDTLLPGLRGRPEHRILSTPIAYPNKSRIKYDALVKRTNLPWKASWRGFGHFGGGPDSLLPAWAGSFTVRAADFAGGWLKKVLSSSKVDWLHMGCA
jgi:hypothetical protein